jgi:hypothetical protein
MREQQETNPEAQPRRGSGSQLWDLLIRGVLAAVVITVVAPRVVAELRTSGSAKSAERRETDKKPQGEDPRPATAAEAGGWRPLFGGGGGGYSGADVMACNRAAQAARRHPSQKLPSDLASAMAGGNGTLMGATADSLRRVGVRARDDARAAAVYEACIFERSS